MIYNYVENLIEDKKARLRKIIIANLIRYNILYSANSFIKLNFAALIF